MKTLTFGKLESYIYAKVCSVDNNKVNSHHKKSQKLA